MKREDLTEKLLDIKREKGWSWKHICETIGGSYHFQGMAGYSIHGEVDIFGATVGVDRELDLSRGFTVTDSGLTVVGKNIRIPS